VIEEEPGNGAAFRMQHGIADDGLVLSVLPGSRRGEVRRLLPIFLETARRLSDLHPGLVVAIPTVDTVAAEVEAATAALPFKTIVVRGASARRDALAASTVALAASGTVALELARAQVPMVISYRIAPVTAAIYRHVVTLPHFCLINILLGRRAVPELMQEACTPDHLTQAVQLLLVDQGARAAQREACGAALAMLGQGDIPPSLRAADKIMELVRGRNLLRATNSVPGNEGLPSRAS
jgi:lipid-A-disaccharide synthase